MSFILGGSDGTCGISRVLFDTSTEICGKIPVFAGKIKEKTAKFFVKTLQIVIKSVYYKY